ncbi:uncharacterized protein C8R40DRAFT_1098282 [Lentinula edodes]|uniref:uncharacterized protein n=1 Tax=Lentinula edodes TaxID=5353 RepID=UPI001E8D47AC|nr:uncharacterized protein C8R40DRAFT_1098282 [Lentinula edodes]KAH7876687.1 hypothetical protein C8R40DRAFT_1098282 [Lentinula edodes]
MSDMADFPLTRIGTPSFVPLLLTNARLASGGLPIEPVIFQSILLCLIAGNKHLILRTVEDDIGLVVKLAVKTLATVFGLLTHRIRIHRRTGTSKHDLSAIPGISTFLRSLFVPISGTNSSHLGQDEVSTLTGHGARRYRKRPDSRSRSRSATVRSMTSQYTKSLSYPNDLLSAKSLNTAPSLSLSASEPFGDYNSPSITEVVSPTHINTASRNSSLSALPQPTFPHSYSDPTPLRVVRDPTQIQLPDALVLSGLEHASLASQRALTEVLIERRVVIDDTDLSGVWPFPKDFILVYICPLDERERPPIHKPLLDKFALSATVLLHPTVRALSKNFFRSVSHRSSPILSPLPQLANSPPNSPPFLAQALPHRHISPGIITPSNGLPAVITPEIMSLLKEVYSRVHVPSNLHLYVSDLFSATRHHHQLEGRLVSITAIKDASELSRAARVLGGDPTGMELISETLRSDARTDDNSTTGGETGDERFSKVLNDVESAFVVIDPQVNIENHLSTEFAHEDSDSVRVPALPVLDLTQADIARIVPRVLTHRLRVKDGPEDEVLASAVFGAAFSATSKKEERGRKRDRNRVTVKELLVEILQEV